MPGREGQRRLLLSGRARDAAPSGGNFGLQGVLRLLVPVALCAQRATGTSSRRTPCRPKFPPEGAASRALPERSSLRCPSRPGTSPPAHGGPAKPESSFGKAAFSRAAPFEAAIAAARQGARYIRHWWACVRKPGRHCRSLEAAPRHRPMRWRWRGQWRARRGKPW